MSVQDTMALVVVVSFSIQRFIEYLFYFIEWKIKPKGNEEKHGVPKQILALSMGLVFAWVCDIELLRHIDDSYSKIADTLITGLALGGGTEGLNAALKSLGYLKKANKKMSQNT